MILTPGVIYAMMCDVVDNDPKLLLYYADDLYKHDKRYLLEQWGRDGRPPFFWLCRECGTQLATVDDDEPVKYIESVLRTWARQYKVAYIYNGKTFSPIALKDVIERVESLIRRRIANRKTLAISHGKEAPCQL